MVALPEELEGLAAALEERGFERRELARKTRSAIDRAMRLTRGDTSVRIYADSISGWSVDVASARWSGGWCEADAVLIAEGRQPGQLLDAIDAGFDRLPGDPARAARLLGETEDRLARLRTTGG